ncbi:MAG TPA: DUF6583 family protein [Pseudogracilibacillus sp.]|nr:DUF6583 family protein [Pseudogracilibacillus sp.]
MTEENNSSKPTKKSGFSVKLVAIIIGILVVAGGASAYFFLGGSPKEQYFKAEIDTYDFMKEKVTDRFANELEWSETTKDNRVATTMQASAEYNDPYAFGGFSEIEELVNQSTVTLYSELDMEGEKLAVDLEADIAGISLENFTFFISGDTLYIDLPFLPDTLEIEGADLGPLLHELDPYTFDEEEEYSFKQIFESDFGFISEDDRKYIQERYGKLFYDLLPDDAFSSDKEEVSVNGQNIKANKITLQLSEKQFKGIVKNLLRDIQEDERLHEIMEDYFIQSAVPASEISFFFDEFDDVLADMNEEIDDISLPEGLSSTVWIDKGLIVQRELNYTIEDYFGDEVTVEIVGSQLLEDEEQTLNYDIIVDDIYGTESITLDATLKDDKGNIEDNISLSFGDELTLFYTSDETKDGNKHTFDRSIGLDDDFFNYALLWTGDSTFEKDRYETLHEFSLEMDDFDADMFALHLDVESELIKELTPFETEKTKNIGKMDEMELFDYFFYDVEEHFTDWMIENFGDFLYY